MWALRRASNNLKSPGLGLGTARACCIKLGISSSCIEDDAGILWSPQAASDRGIFLLRYCRTKYTFPNFSVGKRGLSSHAGAKSSEEEGDLEDGFSELETAESSEALENIVEDENEDELSSEPEFDSDGDNFEDPPEYSDISMSD